MLQKMSDFFEARLDGYDEHMMTNIESAEEFYPFTAYLLYTFLAVRCMELYEDTFLPESQKPLCNKDFMIKGR